MKVIKTGSHNEMCAGYSYTYKVVLDFYDTVEDAIDEIREWRKKMLILMNHMVFM